MEDSDGEEDEQGEESNELAEEIVEWFMRGATGRDTGDGDGGHCRRNGVCGRENGEGTKGGRRVNDDVWSCLEEKREYWAEAFDQRAATVQTQLPHCKQTRKLW